MLSSIQRSVDCFPTFAEKIAELKESSVSLQQPVRRIVVSGAGPAGLIRAVRAVLLGHEVHLIEKRHDGYEGRRNIIDLNQQAARELEKVGVLHYLREKNAVRVHTDSHIRTRICDLEEALRAVFFELKKAGRSCEFLYDTFIEEFSGYERYADGKAGTISLIIKSPSRSVIEDVDVLVIAEGKKSDTIDKIAKLREAMGKKAHTLRGSITRVPETNAVVATSSTDNEKNIFKIVVDSIEKTAFAFFYHMQSLYTLFMLATKQVKLGEVLTPLVLTVPQGYQSIFFAFPEDDHKKLESMCNEIAMKKQEISSLEKGTKRRAILREEKKSALDQRDIFLRSKAMFAGCFANVLKFFAGFELTNYFNPWSFDKVRTSVVEVGARERILHVGKIGSTSFLSCGDTAMYADPITALGGSSAISTAKIFRNFIKNTTDDLKKRNADYQRAMEYEVRELMQTSVVMRGRYPAIHPRSNSL